MKFLPVDSRGRVPVDAHGQPLYCAQPIDPPVCRDTLALNRGEGSDPGVVVRVSKDPELWAFLVPEGAESSLPTADWVAPREFAAHGKYASATVTRAIALIRYRRQHLFHPRTGDTLQFPGAGVVGLGEGGDQLFPRLDPAIIVMVKHPEREAILLGRNARRPDFYSFVAGYVDLGESLEEACAREVREEAGLEIGDITYWGSAPWAQSGSIMLAFHARARHVRSVGNTDGELVDVRWVTRQELPELPLAREGSIARAMMMEWIFK